MRDGPNKGPDAFRTISELAREIGRPQHILRYWETRFPQLKPLQRAGGRRYYRREDVELVLRIDTLLSKEGYSIRGVQQLLDNEGAKRQRSHSLIQIRELLQTALAEAEA